MNSSPLLQPGYHFKSLFISSVRSVQVSDSMPHCLASTVCAQPYTPRAVQGTSRAIAIPH